MSRIRLVVEFDSDAHFENITANGFSAMVMLGLARDLTIVEAEEVAS